MTTQLLEAPVNISAMTLQQTPPVANRGVVGGFILKILWKKHRFHC